MNLGSRLRELASSSASAARLQPRSARITGVVAGPPIGVAQDVLPQFGVPAVTELAGQPDHRRLVRPCLRADGGSGHGRPVLVADKHLHHAILGRSQRSGRCWRLLPETPCSTLPQIFFDPTIDTVAAFLPQCAGLQERRCAGRQVPATPIRNAHPLVRGAKPPVRRGRRNHIEVEDIVVELKGRPALEWVVLRARPHRRRRAADRRLEVRVVQPVRRRARHVPGRRRILPHPVQRAVAGQSGPASSPPRAVETESVLEHELGPELSHRIVEVERANDGQIELDENPLMAHPHSDDDDDPEPETPAQRKSGAIRVITVVAAIAAAALLLNYFGFVFVMTLQLVVVLIVAGRQPWLRSLIVALAAALATRYIFGELLGVPLPSSFIPGLSQWGI